MSSLLSTLIWSNLDQNGLLTIYILHLVNILILPVSEWEWTLHNKGYHILWSILLSYTNRYFSETFAKRHFSKSAAYLPDICVRWHIPPTAGLKFQSSKYFIYLSQGHLLRGTCGWSARDYAIWHKYRRINRRNTLSISRIALKLH